MKQRLKDASKAYLTAESLSDQQIDALQSIIENVGHTNLNKPLRNQNKLAGIAAAVLILALTTMLLPLKENDSSLIIAHEVAKNHIKLKPLEIQSEHFNEVSDYFTQLEFSPIDSDYLAQLNIDMLGGRYCSIQSNTAAQFRYKDSSGEFVTLYEVEYDESRYGAIPQLEKNENPIVHYVKGLTIEIWVEKGILMASVKD